MYDGPEGFERSPLPRIEPAAIAPGPAAKPFELGEQSDHDATRSLDCLTTAIYYEARSENEEGQRAVAQVVLNRVRHPAFPNSVCGVVYQGSSRRTGCQFSFTCDGSMSRRVEPFAWDRARRIAANALAGSVFEPVGLATHYHTTAIRPWWAPSLTRAVTVGSHIFYRWRGEWGRPLAFRALYAGEPDTAPAAPAEAAAENIIPAADTGAKVVVHRGEVALADRGDALIIRIHRPSSIERVAAAPAAPGPVLSEEEPPSPASVEGVTVHR